jgi:hypothetical protein
LPVESARSTPIDFVVASIHESGKSFALAIGATWDGDLVLGPIQKVRVTFLPGCCSPESLVELVEPEVPDSPVSRFLKQGSGLHHLCYELGDPESRLRFCKSLGGINIRPPVRAVVFGGPRIAWAVTKKEFLRSFSSASDPHLDVSISISEVSTCTKSVP